MLLKQGAGPTLPSAIANKWAGPALPLSGPRAQLSPLAQVVRGEGGIIPTPRPPHGRPMIGRAKISYAFSLRAGSPVLPPPTPPPPELTLLCCPGKVQGPLSQVLQLVKGRASSTELMTCGQLSLSARGGEGGGKGAPSLCQQMSGMVSSPTLASIGLSHPYSRHKGQLHCAAWMKHTACR